MILYPLYSNRRPLHKGTYLLFIFGKLNIHIINIFESSPLRLFLFIYALATILSRLHFYLISTFCTAVYEH